MVKKRTLKSLKDPQTKLLRHRFSDSKYRQTLHYLYELLNTNFKTQSTRDSLLNNVLKDIEQMEENILTISGPDAFNAFRRDFSSLYPADESLWKSKKDHHLWWLEIDHVLQHLLDNSVNAVPVTGCNS